MPPASRCLDASPRAPRRPARGHGGVEVIRRGRGGGRTDRWNDGHVSSLRRSLPRCRWPSTRRCGGYEASDPSSAPSSARRATACARMSFALAAIPASVTRSGCTCRASSAVMSCFRRSTTVSCGTKPLGKCSGEGPEAVTARGLRKAGHPSYPAAVGAFGIFAVVAAVAAVARGHGLLARPDRRRPSSNRSLEVRASSRRGQCVAVVVFAAPPPNSVPKKSPGFHAGRAVSCATSQPVRKLSRACCAPASKSKACDMSSLGLW